MKSNATVSSNQRFGRWTVLEKDNTKCKKGIRWICKCDCGTVRSVLSKTLRNGNSTSCGCFRDEMISRRSFKHGFSVHKSKEYSTWLNMKNRCINSRNEHYDAYGERGITVCERWLHSFENFLEDMGCAPSKNHSIDRLDVNGNYEPSNCKWSTQLEQVHNQRNRKDSTTGIAGVTWIERLHKYRVRIQFDKKRIDVGYCETIEEARRIRIEAEMFYWKKE